MRTEKNLPLLPILSTLILNFRQHFRWLGRCDLPKVGGSSKGIRKQIEKLVYVLSFIIQIILNVKKKIRDPNHVFEFHSDFLFLAHSPLKQMGKETK